MGEKDNKISGGAIMLSRNLIKSDVFLDKPPLYLKIWIYTLMKAFWTDGIQLKRGECLISYPELSNTCSHKVGWRKIRPTKKQLFGVYDFLRKSQRITTRKTTRGMIVKVLKYGKYQNLKNYEGNNEGKKKVTAREHYRKEGYKKDIRKLASTPSKKKKVENNSITYNLLMELCTKRQEQGQSIPHSEQWVAKLLPGVNEILDLIKEKADLKACCDKEEIGSRPYNNIYHRILAKDEKISKASEKDPDLFKIAEKVFKHG